ncbi:MAG: hypothetical protein K8R85_00535 [Bacteroidetes bacterium]|nr:hypothetical protein [Bacteroidota bacterium]
MDSVEHIVTNLGQTVNTPYDEFSPIISSDGLVLIFASTRPISKEDIAKKVQGFENVYISYYNDMTWKWSEAKMLGETINQPGKNTSPIALNSLNLSIRVNMNHQPAFHLMDEQSIL